MTRTYITKRSEDRGRKRGRKRDDRAHAKYQATARLIYEMVRSSFAARNSGPVFEEGDIIALAAEAAARREPLPGMEQARAHLISELVRRGADEWVITACRETVLEPSGEKLTLKHVKERLRGAYNKVKTARGKTAGL
jgi:hypothetical protein